MNMIILAIGISILFIAVFSSLSILDTLISKYEQCKEHMFSEMMPECDMTDLGVTFSSGIMLAGFLSITSAGAAYILLRTADRTGNQQSGF